RVHRRDRGSEVRGRTASLPGERVGARPGSRQAATGIAGEALVRRPPARKPRVGRLGDAGCNVPCGRSRHSGAGTIERNDTALLSRGRNLAGAVGGAEQKRETDDAEKRAKTHENPTQASCRYHI